MERCEPAMGWGRMPLNSIPSKETAPIGRQGGRCGLVPTVRGNEAEDIACMVSTDCTELVEAICIFDVTGCFDLDPSPVELPFPHVFGLVPSCRGRATVAIIAAVGADLVVHLHVQLVVPSMCGLISEAFGVDRWSDLITECW